MSKKTQFPKFTSDRRLEMIAQAMKSNLSVQQLFELHETELTGYGVSDAKRLHTLLYQRSNKLAKQLNEFNSKKTKIEAVLANPTGREGIVASLKNHLNSFTKLGLDPLQNQYESLRSESMQNNINIDSLLEELNGLDL